MNNPLLVESPYPYGAPQFDKIENRHYLPAFETAINEAKAEIDCIVSNPEAPDFHNTIEALEFSGKKLSRISEIFYNILEADSDDELQDIAEKISPMMNDYSMYVALNEELFMRVKTVYDNPGQDLAPDQKRLLENTYRSFARQGAFLKGAEKEEYSKCMAELSLLTLRFGKNVLDATNAYELNIVDPDNLAGMPEYVKDAGRKTAEDRGQDGWTYTLDRPSYGPFMQYCANPELRRQMYMAYNTRAVESNSEIVRRIAELRLRVANLLGYETWADYVLEENMAKNTDTVQSFLEELMVPSLPFARKEVSVLYDYAKSHGFEETASKFGLPADRLMPWDFSFWAEKYKSEKYELDDEQLKPYFRLENCIDAVFGLAGRLYGISFEERNDIPVYHKDVKVFDVKDSDGRHLSLFYADFFPRASKRGGAWMTEFRGQSIRNGVEERPLVSIVTNFTKPSAGTPSLITHDELVTLLHEFGHSLHGMFAEGRYPSLCGTNVARDFVELPSQIMENWAFEPEFLNSFAKDYRTGEVIPQELVQRITAVKNYLSGYYQVRQLDFGELDMAWHTLRSMPECTVMEYEENVLEPYRVLPYVKGTSVSTSFNHIFSGGYSAGYYSYKWAEVLEADAFAAFEENGIFDRATAGAFRTEILSKGDTEDPAVLYRSFRGHDPKPEALMKKLGLV